MRPRPDHPGTSDRALSHLAPMYIGEADRRPRPILMEDPDALQYGNGNAGACCPRHGSTGCTQGTCCLRCPMRGAR